MMRLLPFLLLLIACTGKDSDDDDDDDGGDTSGTDGTDGTDGADGTDGTDGADGGDGSDDGGPFFEASGTLGGEEIALRCDSSNESHEFYSIRIDHSGQILVRTGCVIDTGAGGLSVTLDFFNDGPHSTTTCEPSVSALQVWSATGAIFDCTTDTTTTFLLEVDEWTENADGSLTTEGGFSVTGESSSMGAVELEGAFHLISRPG